MGDRKQLVHQEKSAKASAKPDQIAARQEQQEDAVSIAPSSSSPIPNMLQFQQALGNQAVTRLVQREAAAPAAPVPATPSTATPTAAAPSTATPAQEGQAPAAVPEPRYSLVIGSVTLENATQQEALMALWKHYNHLKADIVGEEAGYQAQLENIDDHPLVSFISDKIGGTELPSESLYDEANAAVFTARIRLRANQVEKAVDALIDAEAKVKKVHKAFADYIGATVSGAETATTALKVTVVVGAVAASVATGGLAASAELGLVGSSFVGALGAGGYGMTQEFAGQSGEMMFADRQEFDFKTILKRGAKDAITGFVGGMAGGALTNVAKRSFGSYLARYTDDELLALGQAMGMKGPIPKDFLMTSGQKWFADFIGGVGSAPLSFSVGTVYDAYANGMQIQSADQFVDMVVGDLVQNGATTAFVSALTHGSSGKVHASEGGTPTSAGGEHVSVPAGSEHAAAPSHAGEAPPSTVQPTETSSSSTAQPGKSASYLGSELPMMPPVGEIKPPTILGESPLELDLGPHKPAEATPLNEFDFGPVDKIPSLELDTGPMKPYEVVDPNLYDFGPMDQIKNLKLAKPNEPVRQPRKNYTFGEPSQEKAGTEHRQGQHFHEYTPAEVALSLRVDYDPSAGRPRKISYRIDPSSMTEGAQLTERSFTRDPSVEGAQPRDAAYTNTGLDRGHLVQREAGKGDPDVERSADLMTMVVPMSPNLNRGAGSPWRAAESGATNYVRTAKEGVTIEVEPIYGSNPARLPDGTPIPIAVTRRVVSDSGKTIEYVTYLNK